MPARLSAFVVWALVAASVAFWFLRLGARAPEAPANTVLVGDSVSLSGDVSRLLGAAAPAAEAAAPAPLAAASRFKLTGIMAPRASSGSSAGLALIAVDGKPPRPYAVGAALDAEWVVKSVSLRSVALGPAQGEAALTLDMAPLTSAATGTLPPAQRMAPDGAVAGVGAPVPAGVPPQPLSMPPQSGGPGGSPLP